MYDLVTGPKPADVTPDDVPEEILIDTGVPGVVTGTPKLSDYGTFAVDNMEVLLDASGNSNIVGAQQVAMALYYVDELAADLWASLDAALAKTTDPATVACTVNPDTTREFEVGDFVVFNDEAKDPDNSGRRSFECAQIVGPGNEGDVVPSGNFQFQRAYPGVPAGQATLGTLRCAHMEGVRFYKLDFKIFTFSVKKGFFRTPGLPARVEAKLLSACVVAALVGVANQFGFGPFTVFPLSHHSEPFKPGDRTCNGGAYTFQIPGALAVQENVAIPIHRRPISLSDQDQPRRRRDVGAARIHGHRAVAADRLQEHVRLHGEQPGIRSTGHALPTVCRLRHHAGAGHHWVRNAADGLDGIVRREPPRIGGRAIRPHRSRRLE